MHRCQLQVTSQVISILSFQSKPTVQTKVALLSAVLTALLPCAGFAESHSGAANPPAELTAAPAPLWEVRFAGFGRYGESYPAAKEQQLNVVPLPFPIYRGKFLRVGDETQKPVRTRLFRRDRIKLDIDFGLNFPVDSDDIDARTGMPDLDLLGEAGPELELQFNDPLLGGTAWLALQARGAVSMDGLSPDWRGMVFSTEFRHQRKLFSARTELLTRITPEFATADYMDFFYGVAPEFATLARPAYGARSGYLGTRVGMTVKHRISETLELRTGFRLGLYQGARNENSPLFTDDITTSAFVAFLWKFWESEQREYEPF